MLLKQAAEADFPEIISLANIAYRGKGEGASWNVEEGILEGQRMNESLLREDLAKKPDGFLLIHRDPADGPLLGTVWLNPEKGNVWHLGLLTVRPDMQNHHLGRNLLTAAEEVIRARGGKRVRIDVLHVRDALISWYQRRGYRETGVREPFPYGDDRFGKPLRDDLYFVVLEKAI